MGINLPSASQNDEESAPMIFLLTGIPGAGKTATAEALAERLGRAVHIDAKALPQQNAALMATSAREAGFIALVEDVIVTRERLHGMQKALLPRPSLLVVLAPRLTAVSHRAGPEVVGRWGFLDEVMRRELTGIGFWLDTSEQGSEEVADIILSRASGERDAMAVSLDP
jgi:chloramphenicol 3-O-phosphotransferase